MKKPIFCVINDLHLKTGNVQQVLQAVKNTCMMMNELKITRLFIAGDIIDSRISQRQDILTALIALFDTIAEYNIIADVLVGNHDKTDYKAAESFLDAFKYHPAVRLYSRAGFFEDNGICYHLFPFFQFDSKIHDEEWQKVLLAQSVSECEKNILIAHMSVEGSVNNDGSKVTGGFKRSELSMFDITILGHYHNTHMVGKKILHTPSLMQDNFGEDENKGATIFYEDLSHEVIDLGSPLYKVYRFNLINGDSVNDLLDVADSLYIGDNHIRFEIIGNDVDVNSIDTTRFEAMGINVSKKYASLEPDLQTEEKTTGELQVWTPEIIMERFKVYCEKSGKNLEEGLTIIRDIING